MTVPPAKTDNQLAVRAFLKLWIAGTVGGLLGSLVRAVGDDYGKATLKDVDWCHTYDLVARYIYVLWLVVYFFVTGLRLELKTRVTIGVFACDIMQTLVSFVAAYSLGFVVAKRGYAFAQSSIAFTIVNAAVFCICVFALPFVGDGKLITALRASGAALAAIALVIVLSQPKGPLTTCSMKVCAVTIAVLWALLVAFGWLRIRDIG